MYLATFYERRGEFDKALLYYQQASALNPLNEYLRRQVKWLKSSEVGQEQLP
jgi:hypothetical protein